MTFDLIPRPDGAWIFGLVAWSDSGLGCEVFDSRPYSSEEEARTQGEIAARAWASHTGPGFPDMRAFAE